MQQIRRHIKSSENIAQIWSSTPFAWNPMIHNKGSKQSLGCCRQKNLHPCYSLWTSVWRIGVRYTWSSLSSWALKRTFWTGWGTSCMATFLFNWSQAVRCSWWVSIQYCQDDDWGATRFSPQTAAFLLFHHSSRNSHINIWDIIPPIHRRYSIIHCDQLENKWRPCHTLELNRRGHRLAHQEPPHSECGQNWDTDCWYMPKNGQTGPIWR